MAATSFRARADWRVLDGFGRAVQAASRAVAPASVEELVPIVARARQEQLPITMRGSGRSYGDASLASGGLAIDLRGLNRILSWDPSSGVVEAEPGLTIEGLWRHTLGDGFWPAVVPGTMFPTLGGCVAMNIHGKNNFSVGPFGEHVLELELLTVDGRRLRLSPTENSELFYATIGGAGLLGIVTRIKLKLKKVESGLLRVEPMAARSFGEMVDLFEARLPKSDYLVGWIDCFARGAGLGRGEIHQANYVPAGEVEDAKGSLAIDRQILPPTILGFPRQHIWKVLKLTNNDISWQMLNTVKYLMARVKPRGSTYLQSHVAFAFLLDYVPNWRLSYGRAGFVQYQLFVPEESAPRVIPEVLKLCQERGLVSYLGVFKRHRVDKFLLSHAVDGYSLALDFSARDLPKLNSLAREMTARVLDSGGKFYLAKDLLLQADELARAYGDRLARFSAIKQQLDPEGLLTSDLAKRLRLDGKR